MMSDPAFGLLLCAPIVIAALAALIAARPALPFAIGIAICAVAACGLGWRASGAEKARSAANVSAELAAAAAAPHQSAARLTAAQFDLARHPSSGGDVAVDAFDAAPGTGRRIAGLDLNISQTLHVAGWAYIASAEEPCRAIGLVIDGKAIVAGTYGDARPDVEAAYHTSSRRNVGFSIDATARELHAGTHVVRVVCLGEDVARANDAPLRVTVR